MKAATIVGMVLSSVLLTGCSGKPTKEQFVAREAQCLEWYCSTDAVMAEAALLDCIRYAQACQSARVEGIQYQELFARLYGRLYLVQRHLGHHREAEASLEQYAHFHAVCSSLAREMGRPHGEMASLIERKYDLGIKKAWLEE